MAATLGTLYAHLKVMGYPQAQLASDNPTLLAREVCFETDTSVLVNGTRVYKIKVGPGEWNTLPYASMGPSGLDIATVTAMIATHAAASDPHGDRAYADTLVSGLASEGYVDSAVAAEEAARNTAIANAKVGLWNDRGNHDASGNTWPSSGGSGTAGAILKGDVWTISVAGTLGGEAVDVGDTVRAKVDAPGTTAGNWAIAETNVQQATEIARGTMKVAAQATVENDATTNDTDAVTPKKWWQAWVKAITRPSFFSAVRGTVITGYSPGPGTVVASDNIEQAISKIVGNQDINKANKLITINAQTGTTYTTVLSDGGTDKMLTLTNASAIACTIPPNSSVAYPVGMVISGLQGGAGVVTLTPGAGVTLTSRGGALKTAGTGAFFSALKTATDTWFVTGDLTT
jgi:hypothetical protein